MAATWHTARVFISSTFRDMQAERDHLVRFVFPRLRRELLKRQIHFIDVDLRWGVTSEQDALEVCREIIDECRPRFLCMLAGRYGWTPPGQDRSITADEVHYAALEQPEDDYEHFFYFRNPADTQRIVENEAGEYREPNDSTNARKLDQLKQAVINAGHAPFLYPAEWDRERNRLVDLESFGDRVYQDLLKSIDKELGSEPPETPDEFAQENAAMESFIAQRVDRYIAGSRQRVLDDLAGFASTDGIPNVLVVTGAPGSGKSALLGQFYRNITEHDESDLVVPHFVGASTGSTNLRMTLRRLCHELGEAAGVTEELAHDVRKLTDQFLSLLRQVAANKRVVLIIDALNQMDAAENAHALHWLPTEFPPNVRVIVSSLEHPSLEAVRLRGESVHEETLKPLNAGDAKAIVQGVLNRYRKKLEYDQLELLLAKPDADTPLYLLAALEELRTQGSYEAITASINELPGTTPELFLWILKKRLALDPGFRDASGNYIGRDLVRKFVSFLGVSRHGLSESELAGLIAPGNTQTDPPVPDDSLGNVAALQSLLQPYLMQRGELLDFYHGQFRDAVNIEYLDDAHERRDAHRGLADYFHGQLNLADEEPWSGDSPRAISELPYHQTRGECWEELEATLTSIQFLEAKNVAGKVFELAGDFTAAVAALPTDRPQRGILRLLRRALGRDIHFIARHAEEYPQALFQSLWNTGWWYDSPAAASYYDSPRDGWSAEGPPWRQRGPRLYELLEDWQSKRNTFPVQGRELEGGQSSGGESPGDQQLRCWLHSFRPPTLPLSSAQLAQLAGHTDDVWSVAFSPDGRRIVSGSADKTVRVWDSDSGEEISRLEGHTMDVWCVAFNPDGTRIVSGSSDKTVRFWDVDSGEEIARLKGHSNSVHSVVFSPDGRRIVSSSKDDTVRIWDSDSGDEISRLDGHTDNVRSVAFSSDGRRIVSGSADKTVRVWDSDSGEEISRLEGHTIDVSSVTFSPDGRRLVCGSGSRDVCIWDADSGEDIARLKGHSNSVSSAAFSSDGRRIVSGSYDDTVRVWDSDSGEEIARLEGHTQGVCSVAFSPDGTRIVSGSRDDTVRVWETDCREKTARLKGHTDTDPVRSVTFSPDGRRIVSGGKDTVCVWDADSGKRIARLEGHTGGFDTVALSPDGTRIVNASRDETVRVWDTENGKLILLLEGHEDEASCVAFSPDGTRIISGGGLNDNTVRVWDAENGEELSELKGHKHYVTRVAFNPDGTRIVSGGDGTVRVWDAHRGEQISLLEGHTDDVSSVVFSPDGTRIVTGSFDKTARVWDANSGEQIALLEGRADSAYCSLTYSLDGRRIIGADGLWGKAVRVWDSDSGECLEIIEGTGDARATAAGPESYLYRMISRGLETVVESAITGDTIAWFPVDLGCTAILPCGRKWAAAIANHVYILELAGDMTTAEDRAS